MRQIILSSIAAGGLLLSAATAHAQDLRSCKDAGVDLQTLAIGPNGEGIRTYYEGAAMLLALDLVEPAAASAGFALLLADYEMPGASICFAATGFSGLDIDKATAKYDPKIGVTVSIPAMDYNPDTGASEPGKPLILVIKGTKGEATLTR